MPNGAAGDDIHQRFGPPSVHTMTSNSPIAGFPNSGPGIVPHPSGGIYQGGSNVAGGYYGNNSPGPSCVIGPPVYGIAQPPIHHHHHHSHQVHQQQSQQMHPQQQSPQQQQSYSTSINELPLSGSNTYGAQGAYHLPMADKLPVGVGPGVYSSLSSRQPGQIAPSLLTTTSMGPNSEHNQPPTFSSSDPIAGTIPLGGKPCATARYPSQMQLSSDGRVTNCNSQYHPTGQRPIPPNSNLGKNLEAYTYFFSLFYKASFKAFCFMYNVFYSALISS
ncbi:unnamed protein product [Protopolystoma xenopodis]|uniref:Uncharacterized protein n=1 Tax=Protopolystoma xenopodis TaxID=117903 RepID=A0A3S5AEJ2_9PLAT|nr:unnamed protein product [Protopolystoma xenopodis]